jgi:hypothetical protein
VDEEEAVPKMVHLPEEPLFHHPGSHPEQKKQDTFSRLHFRNLQENTQTTFLITNEKQLHLLLK